MIINFSIQNFGAIKDKVTLSFEATKSDDLEKYYIVEPIKGLRLLKLALIYGANASGKSTILKALEFFISLVIAPFSDKSQVFDFKPFLLDENTPNEPTFFTLEFVQHQIKYLYEVELNKEAIVNEKLYCYHPNKSLVYDRTTDLQAQFSSISFGKKIKIPKKDKAALQGNTIWNNTVLGSYLKTNIYLETLQEVTTWFQTILKASITPKTNLFKYISDKIITRKIDKNHVVELLKKADLNISDIIFKKSYVEDKIDVFFQHTSTTNDKIFLLPYEDQSDGTQRYYQFAGLLVLMIKNIGIFPIDEIESSLHPELLEHFLLVFLVNAKNSQLIATTHNREFLKEKDIFRKDAIWFTEKKADGGTDLFSAADFDSSVIRDTSSLYNAYKIGNLGAVPNIGDYYIDLENEN
jgi:AAA15 family ATPase/GTPase